LGRRERSVPGHRAPKKKASATSNQNKVMIGRTMRACGIIEKRALAKHVPEVTTRDFAQLPTEDVVKSDTAATTHA
jgi:hypothetical protein